ncbi:MULTISPECIES: glycosyltransferase family 2 protein [unclassified Ruegeria]|uniref:glycosyltransferase family 2 protein n=1 Tax=unclassified Ruegeria TaxID=2625375 RepID=UPI001490FA73|nr:MULTISPECIES: glycosyltransferase family 2 protein [unclassified Ruegeria]NOD78616.1 glycosyltransferase [Ruegeria sp. HKCCD4332]NOD90929.1 glycosyltransferase [Ruegeria sp. HKCCD4318]NOE16317.1 glycosyltransferase [Ruegeria sp. HKCCD4318-2]NOG11757.1 glycosyltransferase family 2 protein [Ruegeria sp. HKCCD4315]
MTPNIGWGAFSGRSRVCLAPHQDGSRAVTHAVEPSPAGGTDTAVDLSVLIVNYNTRDITSASIRSILEHCGDLRVEIIVIDNDSSDGSVAALRADFPRIDVIAAGYNGGYAWGNNIGIRQAQGRYILVLNPDAQVYDGTLERAVAYLEANPEVGVLAGHVSLENGTQQPTLFREISLSSIFWNILVPNRILRKTRLFGDQRYASRPRDTVQDVDIVAGCFMMLPRHVIDEVGMMNDRFFMYSEESEWCWRVRQAGLKVRYNPDIRLMHYGAVSTGQISPWKSVEIAKGHILFLRFTRGPLVAWLGTLLMAVGDALRALWFLPKSLLRPGNEGAKAWRARFLFLLGALVRPPHGQTPPHPKPDHPA